jgi:hypothetical protein
LAIYFGFVLWLLWEWFYIIFGPITMIEKIIYYFSVLLVVGGIVGILIGVDLMLELILIRTIG